MSIELFERAFHFECWECDPENYASEGLKQAPSRSRVTLADARDTTSLVVTDRDCLVLDFIWESIVNIGRSWYYSKLGDPIE